MDVNIFGQAVRFGEARSLSDYPRLYQANYFVSDAIIKGVRFLSVCPRGRVRVSQLVKVVETLESGEELPCLILCDELTPIQRRDLTSRGAAWYFSEKTFWVPFLGASSDASDYRPKATRLSPMAQRICLHIVDRSWSGLTTTQIAERLGRTVASAGNYLREIGDVASGLVKSKGRARYVDSGEQSTRELFSLLSPYLETPVRERVYLRSTDGRADLRPNLPLSGVSALGELTMIADDPWVTYAAYPAAQTLSVLQAEGWEVVEESDSPDILVESWAYDPEWDGNAVNRMALLLDCRDLAVRSGDERLDEAVEELEELVLGGSAGP